MENNVPYEYAVSATYSDGGESLQSDSVLVTPLCATCYELSHDDGTSESTWHPAASNNWAAVKYTAAATGEEVMRFKWYQVGDGGAMYVKIFDDNNGGVRIGVPGSPITYYQYVNL